ncbi:hepatitis A virus cellular receptor 1 homolog [Gadus morhua]|uniref:hepatitis A virus cellular receptor 1 homolog n=1 Tax=Gadus morhua TaxID=8049 RepID=UPI0011B85CD3|nr:hepatitis A virus cellular receptor 1 homolog [Gadus morhua]
MTCSSALRYLLLCLLTGVNVCGGDRDVVVVGLAGHSVTLPCVYDTQYTGGPVRTCWSRARVPNNRRFYALLCTYPGRGPPRQETPQAGGRLQLLGRACDGDASLTIQDLQSSDSGLYVCRVRVPGRSNVLKVRVQLGVKEEASDHRGTTTNQEEVQVSPSIGNIVRMTALGFTNIVVILLLLSKWKGYFMKAHLPSHKMYDNVQMLEGVVTLGVVTLH